jgi:hypothetical protein
MCFGLLRKEALLFCEQKNSKKTLLPWDVAPAVAHAREAEQSFFGSFFSKKELLPTLPKT